ncbi:MAG: hypothetical protein ACRDNF_12900 [Streptosporangiaceae bacterium]
MDISDVFPPPQRLTSERRERIRSVLLDEISAATTPDQPRHAHRRWRIPVAGAATAAAVTAVAVTLAVTVPAGRSGGGSPAQHPASAPPTSAQILLAAATSVARQNPGTYWHFFISELPASYADDQWTAHDGNLWTSPMPCKLGLPSGKTVMHIGAGQGFGLGKHPTTQPTPPWTYDMVQHRPADAAALKARIATYANGKSDELSALIALELLVPAPPGVRAAAYRAIAAFPGVQNRGAVKGGHAVFIPVRDGGPLLLVIDPATGPDPQ